MNLESNFWWYGLRGCLYCGSLFPQSGGLCRTCASELWSWAPKDGLHIQELLVTPTRAPHPPPAEFLPVASLFEWIPGEQEVLSRLLLALKGQKGHQHWSYYAKEFWRKYLISQDPLTEPTLFVPSPAKSGTNDHAVLFTRALAECCYAEVADCLKRSSGGLAPQKRKSKEQRLRTGFEWRETFSSEEWQRQSKGKKIVFVDDIVTSGATAQAAWRQLGFPEDFTIWSLAQRSLSCGASINLV